MIRFHKFLLCRYTKLLKLYNFNGRYIHDVEHRNGSEKPFNSLEKLRYLRNVDYEWKDSKIPKRICLTVIGNGAVGQPRCLCMFSDYRSYMFNCGEGSIRLTKEHELMLYNLRQVFVTEKKWENLSGIADLYLSHQNYGVPKLTLHGPPGIENFQHVLASYKSLRLGIKTIDDSPYIDEAMQIEYVPICHKRFTPSRTKKVNSTGPQSSVVVSYICKIRNRPGDFLIQKCVDFGVPVGRLLLDLKNGEDVILPSGEHVKSSDVHEESQPGCTFLVVDCPYESLIDDFVSEKNFEKYHSSPEEQEKVIAVFHFSSQHVVQSYKYQQWINRFPKTTLHLLLNSSNSSLNSKVVHQLQHTLNLLHPRIFPLLHEKPFIEISGLLESNENIIPADANLQLYIRPKIEIDRSNVIELTPEQYIKEAKEIPGFCEHIATLKKSIKKLQSSTLSGNISEEYPEVIFLGTSSSSSTAYRNVTGILVNVSPDNTIVLDCGEGIYLQMLRYFGYHKIDSVLKKISCIFLSHHHTDHYLGIFQLLKARKQAFFSSSEPYRVLPIMYSYPLDSIIKSYSKLFEPIIKYDTRLFNNKSLVEDHQYHPIKEHISDVKILTVPVEHCGESYGIVISGQNWKIVYSGDAAPTQALIDAGKDCTLLIHEASMEDDFHEEAAMKRHSTPSQVVEIANQMNAEHVILTHFSKRYLAIPLFPENENLRVGCAFDNMSVRLSDLPILPLLIPSLKCLFADWLIQNHEQAVTKVGFDKRFIRSLKS